MLVGFLVARRRLFYKKSLCLREINPQSLLSGSGKLFVKKNWRRSGGLGWHGGELAGVLAVGKPSPQVLPLLGEGLGLPARLVGLGAGLGGPRRRGTGGGSRLLRRGSGGRRIETGEAATSMAGYGAEEAGSCGGARLSSWRWEDIGNG